MHVRNALVTGKLGAMSSLRRFGSGDRGACPKQYCGISGRVHGMHECCSIDTFFISRGSHADRYSGRTPGADGPGDHQCFHHSTDGWAFRLRVSGQGMGEFQQDASTAEGLRTIAPSSL
jgi:hypothetical protein